MEIWVGPDLVVIIRYALPDIPDYPAQHVEVDLFCNIEIKYYKIILIKQYAILCNILIYIIFINPFSNYFIRLSYHDNL